jgi:hypothetical protein
LRVRDDDYLCTSVSGTIAWAVVCSINMLMRCLKVRAHALRLFPLWRCLKEGFPPHLDAPSTKGAVALPQLRAVHGVQT